MTHQGHRPRALTERRRLTVPPAGELRGLAQREPLLHVLRPLPLGALLPCVLPFLHAYTTTTPLLSTALVSTR